MAVQIPLAKAIWSRDIQELILFFFILYKFIISSPHSRRQMQHTKTL